QALPEPTLHRPIPSARRFPPAGFVALIPLALAAQQAPAPAGGGRIGGAGIGAYPQRTVEDQAAADRGRATFSTNCAFCHGADIRGGDSGPSLLRSSPVLHDQNGGVNG